MNRKKVLEKIWKKKTPEEIRQDVLMHGGIKYTTL
jgi:hypothetical protein